MEKTKQSYDYISPSSEAIYPTKRPARSTDGEAAQHHASGRNAVHLPLTRIFQPYEYWQHTARDEAENDAYVSSASEPDPPKSGWPTAPPVAIASWLRGWAIRGLVYFRTL